MENQVRRKVAALKVLPARSNVSVPNLNPLWLVSHTVVRKKKGELSTHQEFQAPPWWVLSLVPQF